MSMPATSERTEPVSFLNSLLILLVGDLAVLLVFLGLVSRGGWSAGVMLLVGSAVPFTAVALLRPHLARFAIRFVRRTGRSGRVGHIDVDTVAAGVVTGIGAAIVALGLTFGSVGASGADSRVRAQLGPIDELVEVPPAVLFTTAGNALMQALSQPELRLLIDADPLTIGRTSAALARPATDAVAVQLLELDTERASQFGGVAADTGLSGVTVAPGHALITRDLAATLKLRTGSVLPAPFGFIIDGVIKRVGIAGLATPAGATVPNIIVGPGTLNRLVAAGWKAPVHMGFALSNAGGVVDAQALSVRLTEGIRQSLATTNDQGGTELVFGDEPVASGLDRVVVQPVKAMLYRAEAARVHRVASELRRASWLAVLTGVWLASLTVVFSVATRRRESASLRTAGLSGSASAAVTTMSIWLAGLIPLWVGAMVGAFISWVFAPVAIVHIISALTFSVGLLSVVVTLVAGVLAMVSVRTSRPVGARGAQPARWAKAGLLTRLSVSPLGHANAGAMSLLAAAAIVVAAGTSGATVVSRSLISAGTARTVTVDSSDNTISAQNITDVVGGGVDIAQLGVLPVDVGPPFTGVTLIGAAPLWSEQAPTLSHGSRPWSEVLSTPKLAVLSSDLLASPELIGKKVGDTITVRDRTTGRPVRVMLAGVVNASVAPFMVWTSTATLTDVAAGGRVPVRFVLQPPQPRQVATALRTALAGQSATVLTTTEESGAQWPTARHMHNAERYIVAAIWLLGALGVAVAALRRARQRTVELRSLRSIAANRMIVSAVLTEMAVLVGSGVALGLVVGGVIHANLG